MSLTHQFPTHLPFAFDEIHNDRLQHRQFVSHGLSFRYRFVIFNMPSDNLFFHKQNVVYLRSEKN
jgi:hypothetical protein